MGFRDLFSSQAGDYSKFRPNYPESLFIYLASLSKNRGAAWDAGAGNGQAAVALAEKFSRVFATEPSAKQLAQATPHENVTYSLASAEKSGLSEASVDLVTVAQAFHWFNQEEFYAEVRRVLRPGGHLALWCYEITSVNEAVDKAMLHLYQDILRGYWDERRKLVEEGYRNEIVPFPELKPPPFEMSVEWDLAKFAGYLSTWSAVAKYKAERKSDPLEEVAPQLLAAWGEASQKKRVSWPLSLRVFKVE